MKRPRLPLFLSLIAFTAMAVACSSATQPRGWAAPTKASDVVLVSTGHGHLDALDPTTRARLWRFPGEVHCDGCASNVEWQVNGSGAGSLKGVYGDPVQAKNGTVYFGDYNGYVYAIRPSDVKKGLTESNRPIAATFKLSDPIIGGVALDDSSGQLYVTAGNSLYKLQTSQLDARFDNKDAKIEYAKLLQTGKDIWGTPLVANGKVYVASTDGTLTALDASTGQEAWKFTSSAALASSPVLNNGLVLVGGFDNKLHALDASTGEEKWTATADSWVWSKTTSDSGKVYFGDFNGNLYSVNGSTGERVWNLNLGHGPIRGAPGVTSSGIVAVTEDGWVVGVAPDGSSKLWERNIGSSINADAVPSGDNVLIAPAGCVKQENSETKLYFVAVEARSGNLTTADGVC